MSIGQLLGALLSAPLLLSFGPHQCTDVLGKCANGRIIKDHSGWQTHSHQVLQAAVQLYSGHGVKSSLHEGLLCSDIRP